MRSAAAPHASAPRNHPGMKYATPSADGFHRSPHTRQKSCATVPRPPAAGGASHAQALSPASTRPPRRCSDAARRPPGAPVGAPGVCHAPSPSRNACRLRHRADQRAGAPEAVGGASATPRAPKTERWLWCAAGPLSSLSDRRRVWRAFPEARGAGIRGGWWCGAVRARGRRPRRHRGAPRARASRPPRAPTAIRARSRAAPSRAPPPPSPLRPPPPPPPRPRPCELRN